MIGVTHISFATTIYYAINLYLFTMKPELWIFFVIGSLGPDIDKRNSMLGRFFFFVAPFVTHRKQTHSLPATAFLMGSFLLLSHYYFPAHYDYVIAFFAGWISHIFLDLFNLMGVYLFWPFYKNRITFRGKFRKPVRAFLNRFILFRALGKIYRFFMRPVSKKFEEMIDFWFLISFSAASLYLLYQTYGHFLRK